MLSTLKKVISALFSIKAATGEFGKSWYRSKTLWANVLAIIGVVLAKYAGVELPAEVVTSILAVINFVLRLITKESTGFYNGDN